MFEIFKNLMEVMEMKKQFFSRQDYL